MGKYEKPVHCTHAGQYWMNFKIDTQRFFKPGQNTPYLDNKDVMHMYSMYIYPCKVSICRMTDYLEMKRRTPLRGWIIESGLVYHNAIFKETAVVVGD